MIAIKSDSRKHCYFIFIVYHSKWTNQEITKFNYFLSLIISVAQIASIINDIIISSISYTSTNFHCRLLQMATMRSSKNLPPCQLFQNILRLDLMYSLDMKFHPSSWPASRALHMLWRVMKLVIQLSQSTCNYLVCVAEWSNLTQFMDLACCF